MLLSRVTKYELDMPHGEKAEFTMEELAAFVIWSVQAYHEKLPDLEMNRMNIRRDGEVIRIGNHKGAISVRYMPVLTSEMHTLIPYHSWPSEMSIPERTVNSVRFIGDSLGYFDVHGESLLPVALKLVPEMDKFYEGKKAHFYVLQGEEFMGKGKFPRYRFKDTGKGQI